MLNIPQSQVGIFHYKRKYPVYNFTIFDSTRLKGYCYVWHYAIVKRGAIEIGSCLLAPARHQDLPLNSVRTDNVDHFPIWIKNQRQLCQNCSKLRFYTKCEKCEVFLCYNDKRNCFKDFRKV